MLQVRPDSHWLLLADLELARAAIGQGDGSRAVSLIDTAFARDLDTPTSPEGRQLLTRLHGANAEALRLGGEPAAAAKEALGHLASLQESEPRAGSWEPQLAALVQKICGQESAIPDCDSAGPLLRSTAERFSSLERISPLERSALDRLRTAD